VIGRKNRIAGAYPPELEHAIIYTNAGMADYANPYSSNTCDRCVHWRKSKAAGKGRCAEYARRMERQGAMLQSTQRACRIFEAATP
jgi:hypothetical protein